MVRKYVGNGRWEDVPAVEASVAAVDVAQQAATAAMHRMNAMLKASPDLMTAGSVAAGLVAAGLVAGGPSSFQCAFR